VAIGNSIYVDPSALLKLYRKEPESRAMSMWKGSQKEPVSVTLHGCVEMVNGLALAAHRRAINPAEYRAAVSDFDDDLKHGHYSVVDLQWRSALRRSDSLSRKYSATLGTRSLDVLHVACAMELGFKRFISYDHRQQALAKAVGLKVLAPV
jgi:predicted nucleic acid-binding protein